MARILRWGLLSTARINRALITPLRASKRNQLYGVASRDPERAETYAAEHGIPHAYGSYEEMLADSQIDVVYNPLPNSLHAEWTIRSIEAGKHVLCEKPFALTLDEIDAVIRAACERGVVVEEGFMYRHHPQTLFIQDKVQSGALGPIRFLRGSFSFFLNNPADVRLNPELGGGSIWDLGCYPISYFRTVLKAEPEKVFGWMLPTARGVDTLFCGQMRFHGGALAQFDSSFSLPQRAQIEICGEYASLFVPAPFKPGLEAYVILRREGSEEQIPLHGRELYLGEVEDMADAILEGKLPRINLEDSRNNLKVILALLESARTGGPTKV
ncbi:MAG TPA: Gfo/Idh/MocA family oxidoreductase [Anaerolineaceae bacterium]|nr:Gfo/Idh/MocA family oxidoreductase [Anaerolineaceae bacterium]